MFSADTPAHSATRRRSAGAESVTTSVATGDIAGTSKPYLVGLRAMMVAARIIGT